MSQPQACGGDKGNDIGGTIGRPGRHARARAGPGYGAALAAAVLLTALAAGCVPIEPVNGTDGNVGVNPADHPDERVQGEPNDSFDEPLTVILDVTGHGQLAGTVATPSDVDVYVFKTLQAGDRLIIDAAAHDGGLDVAIAVFDEAGRILFENDDRSYETMQLDAYANQILRRDSRVYYLAVYRSELARESDFGRYEVLITVVPGGQVPAGQGQVVLLDFDGGTIVLSDGAYTVARFNTADIAPQYAGMTPLVRSRIAQTVMQDYEGLSLDVRQTPADAVPTNVSFSTLLFGGWSRDAFGESQAIDTYNADPADSAIVYTGMFTPDRFGRVLSAAELGTAIGNIASHELGHILGLNHVVNPQDVMDTTGGADTLLDDMSFLDSPLHETIAPLGTQDSFLLLLETLGAGP